MHSINHFYFRHKACLLGTLTLLLVWGLILTQAFCSNAQTLTETHDIMHHHLGDSSTELGCYTIPQYHVHEGNNTGGGCYTVPIYHSHTGSSSGGGCYTTPKYHVHSGSTSGGGCYSVANVHHHSGNSSSGGGCYTKKETNTVWSGCLTNGAYCSQGPYGPDTSGQIYYVGTCPGCLAHLSVYNSPGYATCPNTKTELVTTYSLGCGMSEGQILSYSLGCGKNESTIESYTLGCDKDQSAIEGYSLGCNKEETTIERYLTGCGMTEDEPIGTFTVEKSSEDWCNEVNLIISFDPLDFVDSDNPFSVNGEVCDSTYKVTESGEYEVVANTLEGYDVSPIIVTVDNIDNEGPRIISCDYDMTKDILNTKLEVIADDIMSDGNEGCGLADEAYSFDGGASWCSSNTLFIDKNSTIHVVVRDRLGNTSSKDITISNIAPPITPYAESSTPDASFGNEYYSSSDSNNTSTANSTNEHAVEALSLSNIGKKTKSKDNISKATTSNRVTNIPTSQESVKAKPTEPVKVLDLSGEELLDELVIDTTTIETTVSDNSLIKFIGAILIGLAIATLFLFVLLLLTRMVSIFNYICKDSYKLMGFSLIHSKSDSYEINISENLINRCDTDMFKLHFNPVFVAMHKDSDINIYLPNKRSYIIKPGKDIEMKLLL